MKQNATLNSGCLIAIVDTGISHLPSRVQSGISVCRLGESDEYVFEPDFSDYHGHGTAVASLLSVFCPESLLVAVRVAQQHNARVPEKFLALGIDWCIEQGIRLINVSYSIDKVSQTGLLASVCRKAYENNVVIVAAYRNNSNRRVYPAAFSNVIGVSILKNSGHGQIAIVSERNHNVAVFGGPYQVVLADNKTKIVCGTSFAAVQVTGMIGRMLAIKPSLSFRHIFRYLKKYSIEPHRD
ncbi:hypothetical protein FACS189454_08520 [Planctomycetales bacterium]|nr:hypothetical protein FACS189443_2350 [Planctomycetales bacterium]GHT46810.1 hypothetical protein FACS189454_08520 [Planctomycetales bacterium]